MAADQRKRQSAPTSVAFVYGLQEQSRVKKRNFDFNSHICLKWVDDGKRVVAKEEQIGVSWRHLAPFVASAPCSNAKLAGVVTVPREVFELDDLAEVLSYEVWQSLLTDEERNFLVQFLPGGVEPDEVVQDLLAGDNFHFGNPFLRWGTSLCSGDLHPDAIVEHEKSFKTNKKAYYSELQQYHDNMIRNLQYLKQRCARAKDSEAEILQMTSRPKRGPENILPVANVYEGHKPEENVAAVSESPSSIADEKSYYSDNQKLSVIREIEIQKRIRNQDLLKEKHVKSTVSPNGLKVLPRSKKTELQKPNMTTSDGTKYMSYLKISKQQYELVRSMKQSSTGIQSKTLNHLLGSLDKFNVKPYEMFVEEEQKRIQESWLNLANKDIPAALLNWKKIKLDKQQIMNSLWQEMGDNLRFWAKDEKLVDLSDDDDARNVDGESSQGTSEDHQNNESANQGSISDYDEESDPCSLQNESSMNPPLKVNEEIGPSSFVENQSQNSPSNVNEEFDSSPVDNQSLQDPPSNVDEEFDLPSMENKYSMNSPLTDKEFNTMDLNAENNHFSETSKVSLSISHAGTRTSATAANAEELPGSSVKNVWSSIALPESYCRSHPTTKYAFSSELHLRNPQVLLNQPAHLIDLESGLPEDGTTKDLFNRHTHHMPFFNSCRDGDELPHALIKSDNHHQEEKKTRLEFHPANVLLEPTQFPSHIREPLQLPFALDHHRQKAQSEIFMNQNIQESIYSENNRYPVQGQECFSTLNVRDWSNARISAPPIQPSQLSSGELLNHNWFASENRAHGGWSGSDGTVFSSPSLGSGSSGDQSLYSVLSQCNTLRSRFPYNPVGSSGQMIPTTTYAQDIAVGIPISSALPLTASPFDYLSGSEAIPTLKNPSMEWMSLGHQQP